MIDEQKKNNFVLIYKFLINGSLVVVYLDEKVGKK